jgi:hypothetical protein
MKLTTVFEPRPDGGLRCYIEQCPELMLTHSNAALVLCDLDILLATAIATLEQIAIENRKRLD